MLTNPCENCDAKVDCSKLTSLIWCASYRLYLVQQEIAQEIFKEIETHYKEGHNLMHFIFVIEDWQSLKEKWGVNKGSKENHID
jgi:late competence protein required for DNA uptake (superfamily II DNA/RNA helicase)